MRKDSLSDTHFFHRKKNVSLLFNEQSPLKNLKTENVGNFRFFYRAHHWLVNIVIVFGRNTQFFFQFVFRRFNRNWLKINPVFSGCNWLNVDKISRLQQFFWRFWLVNFIFFLKFNIFGFKSWVILYSNLSSLSLKTFCFRLENVSIRSLFSYMIHEIVFRKN